MKKEDFVALGIDEALAEKAATASVEELKGFVPKDRFNEAIQERNQLREAKAESDSQLEQLKQSAGDNAALQQQISDLQAAAKQKDEAHAEEIQKMRIGNAIRAAIAGSAQDADLVAGLIDQTKLILSDDGKLTGLDEQIKTLKEEKAFLFKEEKQSEDKQKAGFSVGSVPSGAAGGGVGADGAQVSMKDAIAARLQATKTGA